MAHRQLSSLVRHIRRPLVSSALVHRRTFQHSSDLGQLIAVDSCFNKLGNKFFSGASFQKKAGGRVPNLPEKVVISQGQSSESRGAAKAPEDQAESRSNYFLVVGAFSALVIGLLAFFPWDLLKSYHIGERKDPEVSLEDFKQKETEDVVLPSNENLEGDEKKHVVKDLKYPSAVQNQDTLIAVFKPQKETHDGETIPSQNADHLKSSNGSDHPAETDSISIKNVSPADYVRGTISAVISEEDKASGAEMEEVSRLSGHLHDRLPSEDLLLPATSSDDSKSSQSMANFETKDVVLPIPPEQKEDLAEVSVNDKESSFMQAPSSSVLRRPSLLEAYYLGASSSASMQDNGQVIESENDLSSHGHDGIDKVKGEDYVNKVHTESVHNVFDLLEVVHAAELRQAELDAQLYGEAQKRLKHAFQQELKDAQAKEVMYAEEASRLAKEIEFEKEKAAAALELEQKMATEKLVKELKVKEEEADLKLKKAELLSKTKIAAAVAEEKLSYIKDVRDVKQELEALYMVLFTHSEDFRQSHTIHKLAVGTFALENAMKRGAPVQKEVTLICSSYLDAGSDPLLDAAISSIPEQAVKNGTRTPSQLQEKFETLKDGVLELSLIPSTGGGLISHAAAKFVSAIKVKESGQYSDGVAALLSQVQKCLADGRLADAADLLEKGVCGTKAEVLVADWIQCVRDRAIMEQMLLLLQAHATAAASSLA